MCRISDVDGCVVSSRLRSQCAIYALHARLPRRRRRAARCIPYVHGNGLACAGSSATRSKLLQCPLPGRRSCPVRYHSSSVWSQLVRPAKGLYRAVCRLPPALPARSPAPTPPSMDTLAEDVGLGCHVGVIHGVHDRALACHVRHDVVSRDDELFQGKRATRIGVEEVEEVIDLRR